MENGSMGTRPTDPQRFEPPFQGKALVALVSEPVPGDLGKSGCLWQKGCPFRKMIPVGLPFCSSSLPLGGRGICILWGSHHTWCLCAYV